MKLYFKLTGIENDHPIDKSTDRSFLVLIQRAALLGLKDSGLLSEMQHRQAEECLLQLYREDPRSVHSGANHHD